MDSEDIVEKEHSEAERQAELHWAYVEGVLKAHKVAPILFELVGHHYKTAFVHGFKHGQEYEAEVSA